jgi:hypothetical protein
MALLSLGSAMAHATWPTIASPQGARIEAIGDQIRLNGVPMRMQRVLSSQDRKEVISFYRETLGPRHAEQGLPGSFILSQEQGDFFVTVNIRPLSAKVTEVLVSVSDRRQAKLAVGRPLGFLLPANSKVMSDMESVDAGKRSRQLVVSNTLSIETNVQSLTRELSARGFQPEGGPSKDTQTEHVQLFTGSQREAQLTVVRKANQTHIVLTTIQNP